MRLGARGRDLANAIRSNARFTNGNGSAPSTPGAAVVGAQRHLLGAAAAGQQADARLDQAHVRLGRGADARAVQAISQPPPRVRPKGATTTGMSAYLSAMLAFWNWRIDEVELVPLLLLHRQEHQHQVGADGELLALVADHQRVEVRLGLPCTAALQHGEGVGAERVHLGVELDEAAAVAQVHQAGARVLLLDGARAPSARRRR